MKHYSIQGANNFEQFYHISRGHEENYGNYNTNAEVPITCPFYRKRRTPADGLHCPSPKYVLKVL